MFKFSLRIFLHISVSEYLEEATKMGFDEFKICFICYRGANEIKVG